MSLVAALRAADIDARVFFHPLSGFPMFSARAFDTPVAQSLEGCGLNLPCYHDMEDEEIQRVAALLREAFR